jgi:hypothetical protein
VAVFNAAQVLDAVAQVALFDPGHAVFGERWSMTIP